MTDKRDDEYMEELMSKFIDSNSDNPSDDNYDEESVNEDVSDGLSDINIDDLFSQAEEEVEHYAADELVLEDNYESGELALEDNYANDELVLDDNMGSEETVLEDVNIMEEDITSYNDDMGLVLDDSNFSEDSSMMEPQTDTSMDDDIFALEDIELNTADLDYDNLEDMTTESSLSSEEMASIMAMDEEYAMNEENTATAESAVDSGSENPSIANDKGAKKENKKGLLGGLFGGNKKDTEKAEEKKEKNKKEKAKKKEGLFNKSKKKKKVTEETILEDVQEAASQDNEELIKEMYSNTDSLEFVSIDDTPDSGDSASETAEETVKKEKKKKEKKKKEKKEKKPKRVKAKKPKKEKVPPKPSEMIQITKGTVIAIILSTAAFVAIIYFGSKLLTYSSNMSSAKNHYEAGKYDYAFDKLAGMDIRESDEDFYNKVRTIMTVYSEYTSYINYMKTGMVVEGIDSLISGLVKYDDNYQYAVKYEIIDKYDEVKSYITDALSNYGLTQEMALEYKKLENEEQYYEILRSIGGVN